MLFDHMNYIEQKISRKNKLLKNKKPLIDSVRIIHNKKLDYFKDLQEKILPKKEKELLKSNLSQVDRKELEREVKDIKEFKEEIDYVISTHKILEEYFRLDENIPEEITMDSFGFFNKESKKTEIIRDYYKAIDMPIPDVYNPKISVKVNDCQNCFTSDSIVRSDEHYCCTQCGFTLNQAVIDETMSYEEKQNYEYVSVVDYKRINYFVESLNQIQAKEHTDIPEDLFDTILLEIKKEKINDVSKLNNSVMKRLLKKTGYSKYYEHIPYIINSINGLPPMTIPEPIEEKLKLMFMEIQEPWEIYKPKDRNNFFSYPYTINKLCELLGLEEYRPYFPMLKSRDKLYKQDIIWKKIMVHINKYPKSTLLTDVHWRFIPSV